MRAMIGLLAMVLATPAVAQGPYRYQADVVDINQGVYICDKADVATLNKLAGMPDAIKRRTEARKMGCPFHIGVVQAEYVAEEYPVARQVAGACYRGSQGFCEEQAFAVLVYMRGKPKTIVSLWLDEDRD